MAFIVAAAGFLAAPLAAEGQQAVKIARLGWLGAHPVAGSVERRFLQGLRDLGYVEGHNSVIEYRSAEGRVEQLPDLRPNWLQPKLMSLWPPSTVAALAAKQATSALPIVLRYCPGSERPRRKPCAAGRQCYWTGVLLPGVGRQMPGTAHAGRSGGQSSHGPLAARWSGREHGEGHAEERRRRGLGAGGAAAIRSGAWAGGFRPGLLGNDQSACERADCVTKQHGLQQPTPTRGPRGKPPSASRVSLAESLSRSGAFSHMD